MEDKPISAVEFIGECYEGNELIFTYEDFYTPAYKPMIRVDRVWEYWSGNRQMFSEQDVNVSQFRFDGTREVDGVTYNVLKRSRLTSWTTAPEADIMHPDAEPTVDEQEMEVALLREDRGKIWMRRQSEAPYINLTWDADKSQYVISEGNANEMLIFDYTAQPGENVAAHIFNPFGMSAGEIVMADYLVRTSEWDTNTNVSYNVFGAKDYLPGDELGYKFATGVGNVGVGDILGPMFVEAWPDNGQSPFAWFNNQYDLDGNVVYAGRDLKVPEYNGVATVNTERETDMRMFDLMGRKISRPLPGTVYIQNGRKYIAK